MIFFYFGSFICVYVIFCCSITCWFLWFYINYIFKFIWATNIFANDIIVSCFISNRYFPFFFSFFCFLSCYFFVLFIYLFIYLKIKIYILIHIQLCGQASDKNFFTCLICRNKTTFYFGLMSGCMSI